MMNSFFNFAKAEQRIVIEQTAFRLSLPVQAVEKDMWVTAMLQILFGLPCAANLVFKGGTSLSKVWELINRFSEDIDLAIDRRQFGFEGDLTKREVKRLRKASSIFVREVFCSQMREAVNDTPLGGCCTIDAQPDGEGESTYPEPRILFVRYQSVFEDRLSYIEPIVKIEVGSRSLIEPTEDKCVKSMVEGVLPNVSTSVSDRLVRTALAEKTFLEKAFLLHELFSVNDMVEAHRRSRHIYDLYMMMQRGVAERAINDDALWETINHHRSTLTSMQGVDYTPDVRYRIQLIPPQRSLENWRNDYELMTGAMIYGSKPSFPELMDGMKDLEHMFRENR